MVTASERTVGADGPVRDWRERLLRRVRFLDGIERFSLVLFSLDATLLPLGHGSSRPPRRTASSPGTTVTGPRGS